MKKNQNNRANRPARKSSVPLAAKISMVISILMLAVLFSLFVIAFSGEDESNPTVLIYKENIDFFPYVSLSNSIHASGFNYELLDIKTLRADDDSFILPMMYEDKDVIIMAIGDLSFEVMKDLDSYNNVMGYVLVNPGYPGNAAVEGFGATVPSRSVAIFSFADKDANMLEMSDSRMLFERLSGVDTIYGTPVKRGGAFASTVYISNNQNRYLSLSHLSSGERMLLLSPMFQNELSGYLGITFGDGASYGRVNTWFTMLFLSLFVGFAGITMYLFFIPVPSEKRLSYSNAKSSLSLITNLVLTVILSALIIAGSMISKLEGYIKYLVFLVPLLMLGVMVITNIKTIFDDNGAFHKRDNSISNVAIMAVMEILWFLALLLLTTDMSVKEFEYTKLAIVLVVFIIDTVCAASLSYGDIKARMKGENSKLYFGSPLSVLLVSIPFCLALLFSLVSGRQILMHNALCGLLFVFVPYIMSLPIKRCSDSFEITGIVHGVISALLLYIIL